MPDLIHVSIGHPTWAPSIPACSGLDMRKCKTLTALYLGYFSELYLQWAAMRDEIIISPKQRADLLPLYYKSGNSPQGLCSLCVNRCPSWTLVSFPWDLGGSQHKQSLLSMQDKLWVYKVHFMLKSLILY